MKAKKSHCLAVKSRVYGNFALKQLRLSLVNEMHTNFYTGPRLLALHGSKGSELGIMWLERLGAWLERLRARHYKARRLARKGRGLALYGSKGSELGIIWLERLGA